MIISQVKLNAQLVEQNQRLLRHLNTSNLCNTEIRQLLSEILGYQIDEKTRFQLPFYSDYGRNIKVGKHVLIGANVTMNDRGGIVLADDVQIGSGVSLSTVDGNTTGPILVDQGAKISGNVMILPNVHIGHHAIIGAGMIVTHDVPAKTVISIQDGKEGIR